MSRDAQARLSPEDRRAMERAVAIVHATPGADAVLVAEALRVFAQVLVISKGNEQAQFDAARQLLDCADELMELRRVSKAASCNGHAVTLGSR